MTADEGQLTVDFRIRQQQDHVKDLVLVSVYNSVLFKPSQ